MKNSYYVVICECGCIDISSFNTKEAAEACAREYVGDNGFAYIYTTDWSVENRDTYYGGTEYFYDDQQCRNALIQDFPEKKWVLAYL